MNFDIENREGGNGTDCIPACHDITTDLKT